MKDLNDDMGFNIHVYSPGNFIAKEITIEGNIIYGSNSENNQDFTDEQIAKAITAINGDNKALNSKRKWAAVHWYLRWVCDFPVKPQDFCQRVAELPLGDLKYECDYDSIRHFCTLSFMEQDPRCLNKVKASKNDQAFFLQCKDVVQALAKELGKAYLPKIKQ